MKIKQLITISAVILLILCGSGYSDAGAESGPAAGEDSGDHPEKGAILVTAFEPFGGEALNPTELLLERLPDAIGGYAIHKRLLPVEFVRARELAIAEYDLVNPAAVIMLGEAGGRRAITPETRSENVMNAVSGEETYPDNAGYAPDRQPIVEGGPETLPSTLPIDRIIEAVNAAEVPCERSDNVGQFVCNTVMYSLLEHDRGAVPTGFIHVPYIPEQGHEDEPYLELDELTRGIVAAIGAVADTL